ALTDVSAQGRVSTGLDPARVAEIIVTRQGGGRRRGSGYRVSTSTVLTAAHVVEGAVGIQVRFNADQPDEWASSAEVAQSEASIDAAVLTIAARPGEVIEPVPFGRVGQRDAVVTFTAMGFPLFKL